MRIGLSGRTTGIDKIVQQALDVEAEGFSGLWYAGGGGGDALTAIAFAGRATERIALGTSVLATYPCHPALLAARAAATADAVGSARFTLGIGPSHEPAMASMYGLDHAHPGQHTDEYLRVLQAQILGEAIDLDGRELRVHLPRSAPAPFPVPILLGALGPRLLRLAGARADGTITWMANAEALRTHVVPRITEAAAAAGRPAPRIVAGLPVVVHEDVDEARAAAATQLAIYGSLPNYQRILAHGGIAGPGDALVVGDEASVAGQLQEVLDAGATELWLDVFGVGEDRAGSRARTRALLRELVNR